MKLQVQKRTYKYVGYHSTRGLVEAFTLFFLRKYIFDIFTYVVSGTFPNGHVNTDYVILGKVK